jgi:hypothetical protein
MGDDMTVKRPLCGPVAVRMLELQPGMVSRIFDSFKVPPPSWVRDLFTTLDKRPDPYADDRA